MKHPVCRLKGHLWLKKSTGTALNILCVRCGRKELIFNDGKVIVLHEGNWHFNMKIKKTFIYRSISIAVDFVLPYLAGWLLGIPVNEDFAIAMTTTVGCAIINTILYYTVECKVC